jgi:hypothetical protein
MARWVKGRSGNPQGRPKHGTAIAEVARRQLERHRLIETLGSIGARAQEYAQVDVDQQMRAIQLLLAYGYGPPRAEISSGEGWSSRWFMPKQIKLQLPAPHPAQLRVIQEARRFNVVCCGRRWGKTVLGMDRLIHPALGGKAVAWFAPNYRLLADVWRELQATLQPVISKLNQQERRLELHGSGVIEMWSLDSPDAGRGRAYAAVVIDEAAMVPNLEQACHSIRPMLTDRLGEGWFLSTPKGMNYFKALYDRGQDRERQEWASWQMPTSENPYIDPAEIDAAPLGYDGIRLQPGILGPVRQLGGQRVPPRRRSSHRDRQTAEGSRPRLCHWLRLGPI